MSDRPKRLEKKRQRPEDYQDAKKALSSSSFAGQESRRKRPRLDLSSRTRNEGKSTSLKSFVPKHNKKGRNSVNRHGQPPRPKRSPGFTIPHEQRSTASPSLETGYTGDETVVSLSRVLHLLHLICHRNHNQHRAQPFWKWLSLLRRSLKRLFSLHEQLQETSRGLHTGKLTSKQRPNLPPSAQNIRSSFEKQAQLRSRREALETHIRETLISRCYVAFSGLVGDSQFANLGVVLMGTLASVARLDGIGLPKAEETTPQTITNHPRTGVENAIDAKDRDSTRNLAWLVGRSTRVTGLDEDRGEVVERTWDSSNPSTSMNSPSQFEKNGQPQLPALSNTIDLNITGGFSTATPPVQKREKGKIGGLPLDQAPTTNLVAPHVCASSPCTDSTSTHINESLRSPSLSENTAKKPIAVDAMNTRYSTDTKSAKAERRLVTDQSNESDNQAPGSDALATMKSKKPRRPHAKPEDMPKKPKRKKKASVFDELFSGLA